MNKFFGLVLLILVLGVGYFWLSGGEGIMDSVPEDDPGYVMEEGEDE